MAGSKVTNLPIINNSFNKINILFISFTIRDEKRERQKADQSYLMRRMECSIARSLYGKSRYQRRFVSWYPNIPNQRVMMLIQAERKVCDRIFRKHQAFIIIRFCYALVPTAKMPVVNKTRGSLSSKSKSKRPDGEIGRHKGLKIPRA